MYLLAKKRRSRQRERTEIPNSSLCSVPTEDEAPRDHLRASAKTRETVALPLVAAWRRVVRFANGYQDSAVSARRNPVQEFTLGWNDYTTGGSPCLSTVNAQGEKCVVFPGATPIIGKADQLTGTGTVTVPASLLLQLSGTDTDGRPLEQPAVKGGALLQRDGVLVR